MEDILHNTDPGQRGVEHLRAVKRGGVEIFNGWLGYSHALAELRAQHPDDNNAFGAAVKAAKLDVWPTDGGSDTMSEPINDKVRSASLWAASIALDELKARMAEHPNVEITAKGGFRGLHSAVVKAAKQADTAEQEEPELDDVVVEESGDDEDEILSRVAKVMRNALSDVVDASDAEVKTFPDEGVAEFFVVIGGVDYRVDLYELNKNGDSIALYGRHDRATEEEGGDA